MKIIEERKVFDGRQIRVEHLADTTNCNMTFSIYLPPQAASKKVPVIYWLSGLTCTDENFVIKAGAQRYAAEYGVAIVCPDTSPRGDGVQDSEDQAYDLGLGAGFYVNATQGDWKSHYQMYSYIVDELPALIAGQFSVDIDRASICGHSMGGHGALVIGFRNSQKFKSVSAFSPIANPLACPWGQKAFLAYLGDNKDEWQEYDACHLINLVDEQIPLLIDQGDKDEFLLTQLHPMALENAAGNADYPMVLRMQEGYDHSYFFISSFIGEHIAFHARYLVE